MESFIRAQARQLEMKHSEGLSSKLYCPRSLTILTRSVSEGINHFLADASG